MRSAFRFVTLGLLVFALAACSPGDENAREGQILRSDASEASWLFNCSNTASTDDPDCFDRHVVWVVVFQEATEPSHLIAHLGPRNAGLRVEIDLKNQLEPSEDELRNRTFFLSGSASIELTAGRRTMVRVSDAEILGFQTLVGGPRQGNLAPEITLAEFGRYCLLAPAETYADQCAGNRVLWYGLLRGAAPDGIILGLPFDDASIARVKTASPLSWPLGNTAVLRDTPIVVEGVLETSMVRDENGARVPVIIDAHIINFSTRVEPLVEITGVE